jgi:hypothetical protein
MIKLQNTVERRDSIIMLKGKPGTNRSRFLKVFIIFQFRLDVRFNMGFN